MKDANQLVEALLQESPKPELAQIRGDIRSADRQLEQIFNMRYLPDSIKAKVAELRTAVGSFDYDALKKEIGHTVNQAEGPLFPVAELARIVRAASGFAFRVSAPKPLVRYAKAEDENPEAFLPDADAVHLTTDPAQCVVVEFKRNSRERHQIWYLKFVLMPGHVYMCDWSTESSSGDGDVMPNDQVENKLMSFFG